MSRSKGALNWTTREAKEMARRIVCDPEYWEATRKRAIEGTLGQMEPVLWHYAFGKPKERVELSLAPDLAHLSNEELAAEALELAAAFREPLALCAPALDAPRSAQSVSPDYSTSENSFPTNGLEHAPNETLTLPDPEGAARRPSGADPERSTEEAEEREALFQLLLAARWRGEPGEK
jgi:hypothetical protein